ncbi:Carbohydrate kinase, FGGY family [hydrothermal vent metagenome]|uniref:Carbohydrate kinase, FGGY family n=1 Tax=hydrothermal vent metagenome TaxID=652676 RepID=A0A3B0Y6W1_9ZZZZ
MPVRQAFIGIDVGTSGIRACAIDARGSELTSADTPLPAPERDGTCVAQDPAIWWQVLCDTLDKLAVSLRGTQVMRIALDGTSSTLLLCQPDGTPLGPALMYNDARAIQAAEQVSAVAPKNSAARGASASLAKYLHLREQLHTPRAADAIPMHQADWLTGKLIGQFRYSDENNALKLGYDPLARNWPGWLEQLGIDTATLPEVVAPGTPVGALSDTCVKRWGWSDAILVAGTTDSTAGFLATGATQTGTGVTSLGSTLVIKVLSDQPVFDAAHGIYSHRLGNHWLAGGASNAGGAILKQYFSNCDIHRYSRLLNPDQPTGLDYYPLPAPGERFPVADPTLPPRLTPRPSSDRAFFQGILEGLASIETEGYRLLQACGAPSPTRVLSVGGGAQNKHWETLRAKRLGTPVLRALHSEAAYGVARLAVGIKDLF